MDNTVSQRQAAGAGLIALLLGLALTAALALMIVVWMPA
jgi:hypothetical protein